MAEEKIRFSAQLAPLRRQLAEQAVRHHVVTVESAEHADDFLKPEFWALVAKELTIGDRIEIRDDSMTFWAEYLVTACGSTWAKVQQLRNHKLVPEDEKSVAPDFLVEFKGPHRKWCVLRRSDKSVIHEGEQDRAAANRWLEGYAKTTGAKLAA